jgi:hypothetical protein
MLTYASRQVFTVDQLSDLLFGWADCRCSSDLLGRWLKLKWPSQKNMFCFAIQGPYLVPGECNSLTRMSPYKSAYPRKIRVDPGLAVRAWTAAFHGGGQIEATNHEIDQVILTVYRVQVLEKCLLFLGARGGAVGWGTALQAGRCGFGYRWGNWDFSFTLSFRSHHYPGVDSARKSTRGIFLGVKPAGA